MASTVLEFPRSASAQAVPVRQALRQSRLFGWLQRFRSVLNRPVFIVRIGRPDTRIVFFGNRQQFVSVGGTVRRVERG